MANKTGMARWNRNNGREAREEKKRKRSHGAKMENAVLKQK